MADNTECSFVVNDENGGAATRSFVFKTTQQGNNYLVEIRNDGISPYGVTLNRQQPNAQIPDMQARVKATGTLALSFESGNNSVGILFTGTLNTTHSTAVSDVVVATFD